jgi:uncharacterized protein (TIGR00290 family)
MAKLKERILLSWSGGKDSMMALWELRKSNLYEVAGLLTVLTEGDECITMHGVARQLLEKQAAALGLPLELVFVPQDSGNEVYLARLNEALARARADGLQRVAFGDLFLDDLRDFREEHLEAVGMEAIFPLWHRDTKELAYAFLNTKFKAVITCVDEQSLDLAFAGRMFDRTLLSDLPITVDPCGENGEFHTFVFDGPLFSHALPIKVGAKRSCERFHYCEIASRKVADKASLKPEKAPKAPRTGNGLTKLSKSS